MPDLQRDGAWTVPENARRRAANVRQGRMAALMKHTGTRIPGFTLKDGKPVRSGRRKSVSAKIAERKNPKQKFKRGK